MVTSVKKNNNNNCEFLLQNATASITFNEAMSDGEFFRFLNEEGVPAEDCEIIKSECQFGD